MPYKIIFQVDFTEGSYSAPGPTTIRYGSFTVTDDAELSSGKSVHNIDDAEAWFCEFFMNTTEDKFVDCAGIAFENLSAVEMKINFIQDLITGKEKILTKQLQRESDKGQAGDSDERLTVSGLGTGISIREITDEGASRIISGENCQTVLGDLSNSNDVWSLRGPTEDSISITDAEGEKVALESVRLNWEPGYDIIEKIEEIEDVPEIWSTGEESITIEELKSSIREIAHLFPTNDIPPKIFVRTQPCRGGWADIRIPTGSSTEDVLLVEVELEGLENACAYIYLGFIMKIGKNIQLHMFDSEETLVNIADPRFMIYDTLLAYGTIWEN